MNKNSWDICSFFLTKLLKMRMPMFTHPLCNGQDVTQGKFLSRV